MSDATPTGVEGAPDGGPPIVLFARGLALSYGSTKVLEGVDLDIRRGEFWALLGPNGAGKTTLVNAMLGVHAPSGGILRRHKEFGAANRIGFVPQAATLNRKLPTTVREFVGLGTVGLRDASSLRATRVDRALDMVEMRPFARKDLWTLSSGQRQRALVARALVRDPYLLVLDEPTTGLDIRSERRLLQTIEHLREKHRITVILVTHNLQIARSHATHAAIFGAGRVRTGEASAMLTEPALREAFDVDETGAPPPPGRGPAPVSAGAAS